MAFHSKLGKAIQAAGVLLRGEASSRMSRLRLIKLLYIADRESMRETGRPITGDRVVAMEHGPVLSGVYDCIEGECPQLLEWEQFFVSDGRDVLMKEKPPNDELCRYEIETLQRVSRERVDKSDWDVTEETHRYPEWKDPGQTSKPIPFEDILRAVGQGNHADRILREAAGYAYVERVLGGDG